MLLVYGKLIAYAKIHLKCVAHRIKTSVSTRLDNAFLLALLYCDSRPDSVLLLEVALRNREHIRLSYVIIFEYLIYNRRCKLLVLAV